MYLSYFQWLSFWVHIFAICIGQEHQFVDSLHITINSSPPGLNGCHFTDDTFKCIFILIQISLRFVPKGLIDNKAALAQVMAWCQTGNKPLPEPMLTKFADAYMRH